MVTSIRLCISLSFYYPLFYCERKIILSWNWCMEDRSKRILRLCLQIMGICTSTSNILTYFPMIFVWVCWFYGVPTHYRSYSTEDIVESVNQTGNKRTKVVCNTKTVVMFVWKRTVLMIVTRRSLSVAFCDIHLSPCPVAIVTDRYEQAWIAVVLF